MSQYFFPINDNDKIDFESFLEQTYSNEISQILEHNQSINCWAFAKGEINRVWKKIKKNDIIFFGFQSEIKCYGVIQTKNSKDYSGELINLKKSIRKNFLFFSKLQINPSINFYEVVNKCSDITNIKRRGGVHALNANIKFSEKEIKTDKIKSRKYSPKQFTWSKTPAKPVGKEKNEIFRYVRDVPRVSKLKKMYNFECQICGLTIKYGKNKLYCEVHHYYPLHEGGLDYENNMIVLCPNHHTMFDLKEMKIDFDQKTILDKNGLPINDIEIKFLKNHNIDTINLESQLK